MAASVYVLAVLGETPAVVLELLWWLAVEERHHIAGIEVWTTAPSEAALRRLLVDLWPQFERVTGPLPEVMPSGPPASCPGLRIHTFDDDNGVALTDVRTASESARVSAALHDRVRVLREELSERVTLVGSLAGGRKTASAALQTAFCLQARHADRLVHVLLHADLERWLREQRRMADFNFPSQEWAESSGVPLNEQVTVYDVAFPRLRYMVPRRLAAALDGLSWDAVWPVLEANIRHDPEATLCRVGDRWTYTIVDASDNVLYAKGLTRRLGAVLAATVRVGGEPKAAELVAWLDARAFLWSPKPDDDTFRPDAIRAAFRDLRAALGNLPMGLEPFGPPQTGYGIAGLVTVDALGGRGSVP